MRFSIEYTQTGALVTPDNLKKIDPIEEVEFISIMIQRINFGK